MSGKVITYVYSRFPYQMRRLFFYDSYVVFWILKSKPRFRGEELIKNESWLVEDVVLTVISSAASTNLKISGSLPVKFPMKNWSFRMPLATAGGDLDFKIQKTAQLLRRLLHRTTDKWTQKEKQEILINALKSHNRVFNSKLLKIQRFEGWIFDYFYKHSVLSMMHRLCSFYRLCLSVCKFKKVSVVFW